MVRVSCVSANPQAGFDPSPDDRDRATTVAF